MVFTETKGPFPRLRRIFFAGLITILPLTITIMVIVWLVDYIQFFLGPSSAFGQFMESFGLRFVSSESAAYALGLVVVFISILVLGALVEAGLRNRLNAITDRLLNRVPIVGSVYSALSKLISMFDKQDKADLKSMQAVMCFFGGKKDSTGVLGLLTSSEKVIQNGVEYYSIMIPTAPVPVGGAILFVPIDWIEEVDFEFEGLLNIYMSMGVTSPSYFNKVNPNT